MTSVAVQLAQRLTTAEYFALEEAEGVKHELVDGVAYAMVGVSRPHNQIALNLAGWLNQRLASPCTTFIAEMKLRVRTALAENFYYPDVMVSCDPGDTARHWVDRPCLIVEILSDSTTRFDLNEKFVTYRGIESLAEYLVVAQDARQVVMHRRDAAWAPRPQAAGDLALDSLGLAISMDDLYARTGL